MRILDEDRQLGKDREIVNAELSRLLASEVSPVCRAMRYAVLEGGQRTRPLLALRVARSLGVETTYALRAGCAVELLHAASLIVDDLPCMDDDPVRRGKPATHIAFGESTALLAAFGLVGLAGRCIIEQVCPPRLRARQRWIQTRVLETLDCAALLGGQAMDLALKGEGREARRMALNDLKTGPLFSAAVCAGRAYARWADADAWDRFGSSFGAAFQLVDDWLDEEVTNYSSVEMALDTARARLRETGGDAAPVEELIDHLNARAFKVHRCHR